MFSVQQEKLLLNIREALENKGLGGSGDGDVASLETERAMAHGSVTEAPVISPRDASVVLLFSLQLLRFPTDSVMTHRSHEDKLRRILPLHLCLPNKNKIIHAGLLSSSP